MTGGSAIAVGFAVFTNISCQFHFMLDPISLAVNFHTRTGEGLAATLKGLGALQLSGQKFDAG